MMMGVWQVERLCAPPCGTAASHTGAVMHPTELCTQSLKTPAQLTVYALVCGKLSGFARRPAALLPAAHTNRLFLSMAATCCPDALMNSLPALLTLTLPGASSPEYSW
jgi:predicted TIM-barrel enzyme